MARRRKNGANGDTTTAKGNGNGTNLGFEARLWAAADKLRGHMDAGEPFEQKMKRLTGTLAGQFTESHRLEKAIRKHLEGQGHGF